MKFFLLRLDRFIQFWYTSSVIISLEFVFPNLRLTEESQSVRFQSFVSEFLKLTRDLRHGRQRVAPFYHDSLTTTTDLTTGLLLQSDRLVFGRIEERLTDGDVIVVEVFREPLLGHGLLGELYTSLCEEVVVGLITCGGVLFVREPQLLSGNARGFSPRHQGRGR